VPIPPNPVSQDDIARVEARIEELATSIERCRAISLAAKLIIAVGVALVTLTVLGFLTFAPPILIGGLAAIIGGAVLLGANQTTWQQMQAALQASEAMRAEMIGSLELRLVGGDGSASSSRLG
jgi:hypothetical protein